MSDLNDAYLRLDWFIAHRMQEGCIPGVSIALTDREGPLHLQTYGVADLATQQPIQPETLFEIGSITKSFTAVAVLRQYDAGCLDLHARIQQYLPWFDVRSRYGPITVHHLLSHTGGLVGYMDLTPGSRYEVWAWRETETGFAPGTHFHYSDAGYQALGYMLEDLLGESYAEVIRHQVLEALGMTATDPVITHASRRRTATGYQPFFDDRPPDPYLPLRPAPVFEYGFADARVASTATDMTAFVRMLLNLGRGPQGELLAPATFDLMTQGVLEAEEGILYGYGCMMEEIDGHWHVGHDGGMIGFRSSDLADMGAGLGVVILMNGKGDPRTIAKYALQAVRAAMEGRDLPPVPPVHDRYAIASAHDYVGSYITGTKAFEVRAAAAALTLLYAGESVPLERRGSDAFYVGQPDFALFLLRFGREGSGEVWKRSTDRIGTATSGTADPPASTTRRTGIAMLDTTVPTTPGARDSGFSCGMGPFGWRRRPAPRSGSCLSARTGSGWEKTSTLRSECALTRRSAARCNGPFHPDPPTIDSFAPNLELV